jgi:hypothetical protein
MFVFAQQDLTNAGVQLLDLVITSCPPLISYSLPPACNNAGAGGVAGQGTPNPQFWFDLATNQMLSCTSGSLCNTPTNYSANPAILLGVVSVSSTTVLATLGVPYRENPYFIYQNFSDGSAGSLELNTGATTTQDGEFHYSAVMIWNGSTLKHSVPSSTLNTPGLLLASQTPVLIYGSSALGGAGIGLAGPAGIKYLSRSVAR